MALLGDVRHGIRLLWHNPGFAAIAVLSIAIGVGANAAMFALADGLILRPHGIDRAGEVLSVVGTSRDAGFQPAPLSYLDFADLRDRSRTFARLVAHNDILAALDARPDQPAMRTMGTAVSGDLFDAMGLRPALGRFFLAGEDRVPGRDAVIVLDHRTWTERFNADPGVLGRRVRVADIDFTVVGVTPPSFRGLSSDIWPAFYVPLAMVDRLQPGTNQLTQRDARSVEVKGFLAEGATLAQARAEIARLGTALASEHPEANRAQRLEVRTELQRRTSGPSVALVVMLVTLAVIVLLVACANVAGLLTSRAPLRAREVAVRLAIGGSPAQVMRLLIVESLLIAAGGAATGLLIAYGGVVLFRRIEFPTEVPLKLYFELDQRVVLVGLAVAALSALAASLLPAWRASRTDLVAVIKGSAAAGTRQWGRHTLVVVQVALAVVLVTAAAGLHAGFRDTMLRGPGYRTDHLLLMRFDERLAQIDSARAEQFHRQVKERARELPGVTSVALTTAVPMQIGTSEAMRVTPEGVRLPDDATDVRVRSSRVDGGYFSTMAIPILAGRAIEDTDTADAPPVVVVNERFVERFWPGGRAIGQRVRLSRDNRPVVHEVVGVARDAATDWLGEERVAFIYVPREQSPAPESTLLIQAENPEAVAGPMRDIVRQIDAAMPVFSVRTMESLYQARGLEIPNVLTGTVAGMGAMGVGLALIGLYGLMTYAVNRRTREIGIRMAVGAAPGAVLAMVMRRALLLTGIGLGVGTAGAAAAARGLQLAIPQIGNFNPLLFVSVVAALLGVSMLAAYAPARRAARVDPLRALRTE